MCVRAKRTRTAPNATRFTSPLSGEQPAALPTDEEPGPHGALAAPMPMYESGDPQSPSWLPTMPMRTLEKPPPAGSTLKPSCPQLGWSDEPAIRPFQAGRPTDDAVKPAPISAPRLVPACGIWRYFQLLAEPLMAYSSPTITALNGTELKDSSFASVRSNAGTVAVVNVFVRSKSLLAAPTTVAFVHSAAPYANVALVPSAFMTSVQPPPSVSMSQ